MFNAIKAKFRDAGTIKTLCEKAEAHALRDGQRQPGAEHFLLAALDLEDGTARQAFAAVDASPNDLAGAIGQQYADALGTIGLSADLLTQRVPMDQNPQPGPYQAAASGQEVMQALAQSRKQHAPLLGAHVVATVAAMPHGVAARALRSMRIAPDALRIAAEAIVRERAAV